MNRYIVSAVMAVSLACSGMAAASSDSDTSDQRRVVPILVNVNSHGKVTRADTPMTLRPAMAKALRQTVDAMITKPAMKHGKPAASQFILNLAIVSATSDKSEYKFSYVSTQPVPPGSWHWAHQSHLGNQKFALVSNEGSVQRVSTASTMLTPNSPRPHNSSGSSGR